MKRLQHMMKNFPQDKFKPAKKRSRNGLTLRLSYLESDLMSPTEADYSLG